MSMTLPKKTFRISALLLVVCMISTVMLSGTFAKYASDYAGQDTALVARWQFKAYEGTQILNDGNTPTQQLDLFKHAYDKNINELNGSDYIIAPGVRDDFTIKMTFLSDVDAKVTVNFTKDASSTVAATLPIEYSVDDGTNWVALADLPEAFVANVVSEYDTIATAADPEDNTFTLKKTAVGTGTVTERTIEQVVKWRWAFDVDDQDGIDTIVSSDSVDTALGNTSAGGDGLTRTTYKLNVSVKSEQLLPTTDVVAD